MTSTELIKIIFNKIKNYKFLVLICGIGFALLLLFSAKSKRPVYTAKATVFPLTSASENPISNNALSGILGLEGTSKSFSNEASINILELTSSRNVRERVASARLPEFGNKTVTEVLVTDINNNKSYFAENIKLPTDSEALAILGSEMLRNSFTAKMSKNGALELYFSSPYQEVITPVSNLFINKLSQFYIDLKISKALDDYNFTIKRLDSLQKVVSLVDKKALNLQNTTFFTPENKLEFEIPKENISMERLRLIKQRDMSINNREVAVWQLQKATPIISILDAPKPPFAVESSSPKLFAIVGFLVGCLLCIMLLISGMVFKYLRVEIKKSFGEQNNELPLNL